MIAGEEFAGPSSLPEVSGADSPAGESPGELLLRLTHESGASSFTSFSSLIKIDEGKLSPIRAPFSFW